MRPPWEWVATLRRADPDTLVDALEARYLKERLEAKRASPYERARAHLRGREERLQRETVLAEHLLGRTLPGDGLAQHEVTVRGPAGRPTAARFLLANDHSRAARFTFGPPRWFDAQGAPLQARPLTLDPNSCELAPGEERRVRIGLTLPPSAAEVLVPVLADDQPALQLWVRLLPNVEA